MQILAEEDLNIVTSVITLLVTNMITTIIRNMAVGMHQIRRIINIGEQLCAMTVIMCIHKLHNLRIQLSKNNRPAVCRSIIFTIQY